MPHGLELRATHLGHRFGGAWLFRERSFALEPGSFTAITGPNGSGKSTLLRILAGQLAPEAGQMTWARGGTPLPSDRLYRHLAWAGPAVELYPALTLHDTLRLFYGAKRLRLASLAEWVGLLALSAELALPVGQLSSGQRQRVLTALALFADTPLLLLDEPTANLDAHWRAKLLQQLRQQIGTRTLVIASNLPEETEGCTGVLAL